MKIFLKIVSRFNPCCAGCSSGSYVVQFVVSNHLGFNPCCAGCSSGSLQGLVDEKGNITFQSLLCWM